MRAILFVGDGSNDGGRIQNHQDGNPQPSYPTISFTGRGSRTRMPDTRSKKESIAAFLSTGAGGATRDSRSSIARSKRGFDILPGQAGKTLRELINLGGTGPSVIAREL
jgi:hypothetical protein